MIALKHMRAAIVISAELARHLNKAVLQWDGRLQLHLDEVHLLTLFDPTQKCARSLRFSHGAQPLRPAALISIRLLQSAAIHGKWSVTRVQRYPQKPYIMLSTKVWSQKLLNRPRLGVRAAGWRAMSNTGKDATKHKYDGSLCLPRTEFPMRANAVKREVLIQEKCTSQVYDWQLENNSRDRPFVLHDGPPYANGASC
jgi:hypothetical protein